MRDYVGTQISVGDIVVYPSRRGSSLWMNRAQVLAFDWPRNRIKVKRFPNSSREKARSCWIKNVTKTTVIFN